MIVYHVDTLRQLHEGQVLTLRHARTPIHHLYPKGVSSFGERVFLKPENEAQITAQAVEIMFDYVRQCCFTDKPSRFECVFASASLDDSKAWHKRIVKDFDIDTHGLSSNSTPCIYAVEPDMIYIADARYLDLQNVPLTPRVGLSDILPFALGYWDTVVKIRTGLSDSTLRGYSNPELLLVPPVRVIKKVYP